MISTLLVAKRGPPTFDRYLFGRDRMYDDTGKNHGQGDELFAARLVNAWEGERHSFE